MNETILAAVDQLYGSERGRFVMEHLRDFILLEQVRGLDAYNQRAVVALLIHAMSGHRAAVVEEINKRVGSGWERGC